MTTTANTALTVDPRPDAVLDALSPWADAVVPADLLPGVAKRLASLNKRAAKVNAPAVDLQIGPAEWRDVFEDGEKVGAERVVRVAVIGAPPALGGWSFVATVDHQDDPALPNILRTVPGVEIDPEVRESFRHTGATCEHCGLDRLRKDTYLVRHEDGRIAQVGSNCLKDFTGHDPAVVLRWIHWVDAFVAEVTEAGFGRGEVSTPLAALLAVTAAVVAQFGWVSKGTAWEQDRVATAASVQTILRPRTAEDRKFAESVPVTAEHEATAAQIIEFVRGIEDLRSDYLANLAAVFAADFVTPRNEALAASGWICWKNAQERAQADEAKAKAGAESDFVGEVGGKVDVEATVVSTRTTYSDYGASELVVLTDDDGNVFKTFSSGHFGAQAEVGIRFHLTGTVKRHDVFKGVRETVLTRVKGTALATV